MAIQVIRVAQKQAAFLMVTGITVIDVQLENTKQVLAVMHVLIVSKQSASNENLMFF